MNKHQIRKLKSHYAARWAAMRHNQKQQHKILLLNDLFVLKNLSAGATLCYQCLGEIYKDIVIDLDTDPRQQYQNLVMINNVEFKYKTVQQLCEYIGNVAAQYLCPQGRLIFSFEQKFLIYNRVHQSVGSMLDEVHDRLQNFQLVAASNLLHKSQPGYGDYFFCFEQQ